MLAFCERELSRYEEAWKIAEQRTPGKYALNEQPRKEAFWRTWLCDMSSNPFESESYFGEDSKKWMELGWPKIRNGRLIHDRDSLETSPDQSGANLLEDGTDLASQDLPDLTWFPLRLSLISFRRQFCCNEEGIHGACSRHTCWRRCMCVFGRRDTTCIEEG
jgi:hypothetical protein